jgi:hypothetical protein
MRRPNRFFQTSGQIEMLSPDLKAFLSADNNDNDIDARIKRTKDPD